VIFIVPFETLAEPNMRMYGALVAEPCVIPPGEEEIQLEFGTIVDKYLYLNTRTLGETLAIHLTECDLSLGNTVTVAFLGKESIELPGHLALDSGSKASGIAIGLETKDSQPLPLNKASDKYILHKGDNMIEFKAYVQGEPKAMNEKKIGYGTFSAVTTFSLSYD
jgi:P pilus assembly protein, pilin FimA